MQIIYKETDDKIFSKASDILHKSILKIFKKKDIVILALPGGRSISKVLNLLKQKKLDWNRIHIFPTDERLVTEDHQDNNFHKIEEILGKVIPADNLHKYHYSRKNENASLQKINRQIQQFGGKFDIVLLSAGEDGHISSLFPLHASIQNTEKFFIQVTNSPKPPPDRISASKYLLEQSKIGILLFAEKEKQTAYRDFIDREVTTQKCPAKIINSIEDSYVIINKEGLGK